MCGIKRLSQIVPRARTASKNYYLSHIILLTVRAPGVICESPLYGKILLGCMDVNWLIIYFSTYFNSKKCTYK